MITLLSPAKTLDLTSALPRVRATQPRLLDQTEQLVGELRERDAAEFADLMDISPEIADLTVERVHAFETPFTRANARPAVFTFDGDTYRGLDVAAFDGRDLAEAQKTLRLLSGMYGVLRPLDLMQPYRLEMGIRLATTRGATLYEWWGDEITELLRADLSAAPGASVVVDLASAEYARSVDFDALGATVVTPRFEDQGPRGDWKVISFAAKRARGAMASWLVRGRVRSLSKIKQFDGLGYEFQPSLSTPEAPVFRRERG